jgi:hypothetical protein
LPEFPVIDGDAAAAGALREKLTDAATPGYQAEFDPEEAESKLGQDGLKRQVGTAVKMAVEERSQGQRQQQEQREQRRTQTQEGQKQSAPRQHRAMR